MANNYPEYTEKAPDGGGLFDEIMTTLKRHIDVEYDKQRIRGADYTKVWLGSMEAALANTTQYLLGNALLDVQRRKIEAEILAIEAEREKTELEKERLRYEIDFMLPLERDKLGLEKDRLAFEVTELMPLQKAQLQLQNDKLAFEINELLPLEKEKFKLEVERFELEKEKLRFEIDELFPLQRDKLKLEKDKLAAELPLIHAQVDKVIADTDLVLTQDATAKWNLANLSPLEKTKLEAEGKLILQRYKSEIAQISTEVDGRTITGAIGKQIELHEQQRISFIRDTEHKLGKIMSDVWAVHMSVDEGLDRPYSMQDEDIDRVMQKVYKEGLGITLDITDSGGA